MCRLAIFANRVRISVLHLQLERALKLGNLTYLVSKSILFPLYRVFWTGSLIYGIKL